MNRTEDIDQIRRRLERIGVDFGTHSSDIEFAFEYATTDPRAAITKIGVAVEYLLQHGLELEQQGGGRGLTLGRLRAALRHRIPKTVDPHVELVQRLRNMASHADREPLTPSDALAALNSLARIAEWHDTTWPTAHVPTRPSPSTRAPRSWPAAVVALLAIASLGLTAFCGGGLLLLSVAGSHPPIESPGTPTQRGGVSTTLMYTELPRPVASRQVPLSALLIPSTNGPASTDCNESDALEPNLLIVGIEGVRLGSTPLEPFTGGRFRDAPSQVPTIHAALAVAHTRATEWSRMCGGSAALAICADATLSAETVGHVLGAAQDAGFEQVWLITDPDTPTLGAEPHTRAGAPAMETQLVLDRDGNATLVTSHSPKPFPVSSSALPGALAESALPLSTESRLTIQPAGDLDWGTVVSTVALGERGGFGSVQLDIDDSRSTRKTADPGWRMEVPLTAGDSVKAVRLHLKP